MPAKRKGGANDAEKAEQARQAELRKLADEQDRLRRLEAEARQRLDEEWGRAMEQHRQRQLDIQRAIVERALRLSYEHREYELQEALEMKDAEARELRARLVGMQQGVSHMQQEQESALRRAEMLGNELELVQLRLVETEQLLESNRREARDALRAETARHEETNAALLSARAECQKAQRALADWQTRAASLEAQVASDPVGVLARVDPQSTDAETAMLLHVLREEAERQREVGRALQSELDRKGRDEEKSSVLVSLLNAQLEAAREEGTRLHDLATDRRRQLEAVQSLLDTERAKTRSLHTELDTAHAEAAVERRQLSLEVGVHTAQVAELTKSLSAASKELHDTREQLERHRARATEREQSDFQVNVELKGEVEQLKKDLTRTVEELRAVSDEAYTRKALHKAEMDSLKERLQKLQANAEKNEREAFETIAVLRAAEERLLAEKKSIASNADEMTQRLRTDCVELRAELTALKAHAEELKTQKDDVERDLYEKLLRMTANHDKLHEELQRLTVRHAGREKEFVENAIFLNAERETLRVRVEELGAKLEQRRQEHFRHVQDITDELLALRDKTQKQLVVHKKAQLAEAQRASGAETKVEELQQQLLASEQRGGVARCERDDVERLLRGELREMRVELNAAKRTIERYEGALGDASYKTMREESDRLRRELAQQREKVTALTNTVASMKVEAGVAETYREKMLTEQNEHFVRRIHQYEKMKQLMNPIFYELRSIVEKHGLAAPLRHELDEYDTFLRRLRANSLEKRNAAKQTQEAAATHADADVGGPDGYPTLPAVKQPQPQTSQQQQSDLTRFLPQKPAALAPNQTSPSVLPAIA